MKYKDMSDKERAMLYDVAAMAFVAGYCTDRENPTDMTSAMNLIDHVRDEFDKWWADIGKPTVVEF